MSGLRGSVDHVKSVDHYFGPDEGDATFPIYVGYIMPTGAPATFIKAYLSWQRRSFRATANISPSGISTDATAEAAHTHTIPIGAGPFTNAVGQSAGGGQLQDAFGPTTAPVNAGTSHNHSHTHTLSGSSLLQIQEGPIATVTGVSIDNNDVTAALGGPWTGDVVEMNVSSVFRIEPGVWHTIALSLSQQGRLQVLIRILYSQGI